MAEPVISCCQMNSCKISVLKAGVVGVMCRDVKLENVFIANDGRVRLGDFGLTMSMKQEMAISPVGTVEYMAPEVSYQSCPAHTLICPNAHAFKSSRNTQLRLLGV